jgi:hypothetical protein
MSHIHWVARQNKLELPNDEEEVNTRDIHKCDGQAHDPDTRAPSRSEAWTQRSTNPMLFGNLRTNEPMNSFLISTTFYNFTTRKSSVHGL